ncbi:MAG: simple sugar transport system substrate-binding protein [Candidatus Atribacteria bacterium]|nr:simple sugar transport system substrate-binding protein [Candidatus Atribacteria bacterium]
MKMRSRTFLVGIFLLVAMLLLSSGLALAQGKHFEGIKIRFFCGGPPGGPFASVVYQGAKAAEADFGCTVEYVFSGWDPERMVTQFKEAVASDVDGIAIMGHPGDDALEVHIDEAFERGIIVTSQNTTLPRAEEKYKAQGFGYVGQELYPSGYMLGKGAVEMFDLKEGDRAMVWGLLSQPTRGLRTKGVIDALEEAGLVVDYLEISPEVNADAPLGVPIFTGYVSANPDVKLVVTDHGALTATMGTFFKAAGLGPDDVVGAGFDLSAATLDAIRSGYTDLVLDQQQYLQGYLPVLQLCLSIKYKFAGLHIDTGSGLVHAGNVEEIAPLVEEGIR